MGGNRTEHAAHRLCDITLIDVADFRVSRNRTFTLPTCGSSKPENSLDEKNPSFTTFACSTFRRYGNPLL